MVAERYEANFSRHGSSAKGYVIGVTTGLYQVKVSDQASSVVIITLEINVTQELLTNGNSEISSSIVILSPTLVPGSCHHPPFHVSSSKFFVFSPLLFNDSFTGKCTIVYVYNYY